MDRLKAKLRAWLIALVREAVRLEQVAWQHEFDRRIVEGESSGDPTPTIRTMSKSQSIFSEPSFDQMQAEAIKEQEKYYEPRV